MTTIAVSKTSIACDRQMTFGTQKFQTTTKVLALTGSVPLELYGVDKCYIGYAGQAEQWGITLEWFRDTSEPLPRVKKIEYVMLTNKKQIFHSTNLKHWLEIPDKAFAIGSGGQIALGAMLGGKTPKEAVALSAKHDVGTGLGILSYDFE